MSDCDPCQEIICANPSDVDYNLQALTETPLVPVIPEVFTNAEVTYCCAGRETMTYSGTLPSWITLNTGTNCLVGAAGTYTASLQVTADSLAQSSMDAFVMSELGNGNLVCSGPTPCVAPDFDPIEFSGIITPFNPVSVIETTGGDHYTSTFTINATTGKRYQVWINSDVVTLVASLIAPSAAVTGPFAGAAMPLIGMFIVPFEGQPQIVFTASETGLYTVEVTTRIALETGTWNAIVSTGAYDDIQSANWNIAFFPIYVQSSDRIFVLTAKSPSFYTTCINATTGAIVSDTALPVAMVFFDGMIYNSDDDSVWVHMTDALATVTQFARYDPTTGAELEVFLAPSIMNAMIYIPDTNEIWSFANYLAVPEISIYDCTSRTVTATIPLGFTVDITDIGSRPMLLVDSILKVIVLNQDIAVIDPMTRVVESSFPGLSYLKSRFTYCTTDGFVYGLSNRGSDWYADAIDTSTGLIDHSFTVGSPQQGAWSIGFNECTESIVVLVLCRSYDYAYEFLYFYVASQWSTAGIVSSIKTLEQDISGVIGIGAGFAMAWCQPRSRMFVVMPQVSSIQSHVISID